MVLSSHTVQGELKLTDVQKYFKIFNLKSITVELLHIFVLFDNICSAFLHTDRFF